MSDEFERLFGVHLSLKPAFVLFKDGGRYRDDAPHSAIQKLENPRILFQKSTMLLRGLSPACIELSTLNLK